MKTSTVGVRGVRHSETHAQRVCRLRREFGSRMSRYSDSPEVYALLKKLLLIDSHADNRLSDVELDRLEELMLPIRLIRDRFRRMLYNVNRSKR